ncbi:hypothetical protein BDZ89DRAFT_1125829 [Hymenopellis radicata]|nr:hypothetical protein BDZ89DRAFT_1125829 [Hymenopellis radicata]
MIHGRALLYIPLFISLVHAASVNIASTIIRSTIRGKGAGFDPSVIAPRTGDTLVFVFQSGAHNVVASSFKNPCTPSNGFESGVVSVSNHFQVDAPGLPTVNVKVNSTDSLWFFDQESDACDQGAVLAVNPTSEETADEFVANAMGSGSSPSGSSSGGAEPSSTGTSDALSMLNGIRAFVVALGVSFGVLSVM